MGENMWLVDHAHRGSVDQIIFCQHTPPIIITLGFDVRVCIWCPHTGEALGTLEQGLSEGLTYERKTIWRFPIDAHEQVEKDIAELAAAVVSEAGSEEEEASGKDSKEASEAPEDGEVGEDGQPASAEDRKKSKKDDAGSEKGSQKAASRAASRAGSEKGSQKGALARTQSSPGALAAGYSTKTEPFKLNGIEYPDYSKTQGRLHKPRVVSDHGYEWFAGSLGVAGVKTDALPQLASGMRRSGNEKASSAVVKAAKRLSDVLGSLDGGKKVW